MITRKCTPCLVKVNRRDGDLMWNLAPHGVSIYRMIIDNCIGCQRPVLSLTGQFTLLDSYYLDENGPPPESAGKWHLKCLLATSHGPAWQAARQENFVKVRGYQVVATAEEWNVLRHPRTKEALALSRGGALLSLAFAKASQPRRVAGGKVYRVEHKEYHLELGDAEVVHEVQEALRSVKTFPLLALCELLGIADRLVHPEALEDGLLHYHRGLERLWTKTSVSARWDYGVFVPEELVPYIAVTK